MVELTLQQIHLHIMKEKQIFHLKMQQNPVIALMDGTLMQLFQHKLLL